MKIRLVATNEVYEVEQSGADAEARRFGRTGAGDVGFIVANIKRVADARMGTRSPKRLGRAALPDSKPSSRWCSLEFSRCSPTIRAAPRCARKLQLTTRRFFTSRKTLWAWLRFRCGFLGLLHLEIVQERLERESA